MVQCAIKAKSMSESSKIKTFIHEGIEVRRTGRSAKKTGPTTTRRTAPTEIIIYEITPADAESGSWKKWVKLTDLFEIVEE